MSGRSESSPQGHAGSQASQRSGPLVSGTRTQVPAIPWNPCPPSRGIHAHDAVESPPTITWNTHPSSQEGRMRCQWTVRRTMRSDPDGQRRWDRACQEVLAWTKEMGVESADASRGPGAREDGHEGGALRSGIDAAPGAGPDGRAADRT